MITAAPDDDEVFAQYHRVGDRRRVAGILVGIAVATTVVAGLVATGFSGSSPAVASGDAAASGEAVASGGQVNAELAVVRSSGTASGVPALAPVVAPSPAAIVPPAAAPTAPARYAIAITATGYQTELDECQWVRMDLVPALPIVGAHTGCGGRVVLSMNAGDLVTLSGQGLDGSYTVGVARDAHAGDLASAATTGMVQAGTVGAVVLQTCYPGGTGRERLVALIPES